VLQQFETAKFPSNFEKKKPAEQNPAKNKPTNKQHASFQEQNQDQEKTSPNLW